MEVYIVKPLSGQPLKNTLNKSEIFERLGGVWGWVIGKHGFNFEFDFGP